MNLFEFGYISYLFVKHGDSNIVGDILLELIPLVSEDEQIDLDPQGKEKLFKNFQQWINEKND